MISIGYENYMPKINSNGILFYKKKQFVNPLHFSINLMIFSIRVICFDALFIMKA